MGRREHHGGHRQGIAEAGHGVHRQGRRLSDDGMELRDFKRIQHMAAVADAKREGKKLNRKELKALRDAWRLGTLHDMRKTYGTTMWWKFRVRWTATDRVRAAPALFRTPFADWLHQ